MLRTNALPCPRTDTGAELRYDRLLLANGSKPRRLGVPGAELDGVYYLRNVEDSERIKIEFTWAKRAVIIGAGWIGLETASAARAAGAGRHAPRVRRSAIAACPRQIRFSTPADDPCCAAWRSSSPPSDTSS